MRFPNFFKDEKAADPDSKIEDLEISGFCITAIINGQTFMSRRDYWLLKRRIRADTEQTSGSSN